MLDRAGGENEGRGTVLVSGNTAGGGVISQTGGLFDPRSWRWLRKLMVAAAVLLAGVSIYLGVKSLLLVLTLTPALPHYDIWVFVIEDYFGYLDGHFTWSSLFRQAQEHRIFTTRIFLFADAILFGMRGTLPIIMNYVITAATAALICALAVGTANRLRLTIAILLSLGMAWSMSQFWNFAWPYQMQIPFVHLFALACFIALAGSMKTTGRRSHVLLILACVSDFLAVYSFASGTFVALPVVALAVWLRSTRGLWWFFAFHALLMVAYFADFHLTTQGLYHEPGLHTLIDTFTAFAGYADFDLLLRGWNIGLYAIVAFIGIAAFVTWKTLVSGRRADPPVAILLCLSAFVLVQAGAVAIGRGSVAPRYATPSAVLLMSLVGCVWLVSARLGAATHYARLGIVAAAAVLIVGANAPRHGVDFRAHVAKVNDAIDHFKRGDYPPELMSYVFPNPLLEGAVERMKLLRLGPF